MSDVGYKIGEVRKICCVQVPFLSLSSRNRHGKAPGEPEPPQQPGAGHAEVHEGEGTRPAALPHLVVALVVGDALRVLLVEVEAVLHQELHRLRLHHVLLGAEQRQVVHLAQVGVLGLGERGAQRRDQRPARTQGSAWRPPAPTPSPAAAPLPCRGAA